LALAKFGALWKGKPNSKAVLSGKLDDGRRILVFKNEDKKDDRHPDYRLVVDTGDAPATKPEQSASVDDSDLPF
jgi:hypothetical protein